MGSRKAYQDKMLGALWVLWFLSLLPLLGLWWMNLSNSVSSMLSARQIAVLESTLQLEESFLIVEQLGQVMLGTSVQEAEVGLAFERVNELREQGLPYYTFYLLQAAGGPVFPQDTEIAPAWLLSELRDKAKTERAVVLRPLPPGYQQSTSDSTQAPPDNYLVYAQAVSNGSYVAWVLNWDYVFGPWLNKQLLRFGLGNSVRAGLEPWGTEPPTAPSPKEKLPEVSLFSLNSDLGWSWEVATLLPELPSMLDSLRLSLDNSAPVRDEVKRNITYLVASLLLLGGFGLVLSLANRALRREAEYTEAKALFVSQVSHELRTPITALEMYLEILADGLIEEPTKVEEYHRILRRESHRLKRLVENLLTVGVVESGQWVPRKQWIEMNELLNKVVLESDREERKIHFQAPGQTVRLQGDKEALYGVFANLVQNALKYSPSDEDVEVTLGMAESMAEIAVLDRGKGLTGSDYEDVFRPYFRADEASGTKPGVGLGLSLVKQIVEAHGGRVWGSSRPGGGSVFTVQLPYQP